LPQAVARLQCANNLKQIGIALHNYVDAHGRFPAGTVPNPRLNPDQRLSWLVELLPYLEEEGLYRQFDRGAGWEAPANLSLSQTPLQVLECPGWREHFSSAETSETQYIGMAGLGADAPAMPIGDPKIGAFGYDRQIALVDIKDGTSNTLMILESARETGSGARGGFATVRGLDPEDKPYLGTDRPFGGTHFSENNIFKRGHSIGCNALMVDGHVRFLSDTTSPEVLEALATIAGGEKVPQEEDY
jgi:prepilin-type processing-associated H-X9-DG protein